MSFKTILLGAVVTCLPFFSISVRALQCGDLFLSASIVNGSQGPRGYGAPKGPANLGLKFARREFADEFVDVLRTAVAKPASTAAYWGVRLDILVETTSLGEADQVSQQAAEIFFQDLFDRGMQARATDVKTNELHLIGTPEQILAAISHPAILKVFEFRRANEKLRVADPIVFSAPVVSEHFFRSLMGPPTWPITVGIKLIEDRGEQRTFLTRAKYLGFMQINHARERDPDLVYLQGVPANVLSLVRHKAVISVDSVDTRFRDAEISENERHDRLLIRGDVAKTVHRARAIEVVDAVGGPGQSSKNSIRVIRDSKVPSLLRFSAQSEIPHEERTARDYAAYLFKQGRANELLYISEIDGEYVRLYDGALIDSVTRHAVANVSMKFASTRSSSIGTSQVEGLGLRLIHIFQNHQLKLSRYLAGDQVDRARAFAGSYPAVRGSRDYAMWIERLSIVSSVFHAVGRGGPSLHARWQDSPTVFLVDLRNERFTFERMSRPVSRDYLGRLLAQSGVPRAKLVLLWDEDQVLEISSPLP